MCQFKQLFCVCFHIYFSLSLLHHFAENKCTRFFWNDLAPISFSPFVYFPRMSICNIVQLNVYNFFIAFLWSLHFTSLFHISHFSSFNYVYTCPAVEYLHQLDNFLSTTIIRNSFNFLFGKCTIHSCTFVSFSMNFNIVNVACNLIVCCLPSISTSSSSSKLSSGLLFQLRKTFLSRLI